MGSAFRGKGDAFPNLTVKKVPNAVLSRCEWGRDDYSLSVASLPTAPEAAPAPLAPVQSAPRSRSATSLPLFDEDE